MTTEWLSWRFLGSIAIIRAIAGLTLFAAVAARSDIMSSPKGERHAPAVRADVGTQPVGATPTSDATASNGPRRQALARIVARCVAAADHQPCLVYDPAGDDVLIKDIRGRAQFLLMPISAISGIESPAVLRLDAPPYFYEAWSRRRYVIAALGKPVDDSEIGLAINPANARSQDHLHIHIDCVRADVRDALAAARITATWSDLALGGSRWKVRRLSVDALRTGNLFAMVARDMPDAANDMGRKTIFVSGAPSATHGAADATEVYVAVRHVAMPLIGGASAEDLQDHACGVASRLSIGPGARSS
ncbi:CDP-diacylglycerol diphosphatase [Robbsia andropogonis]|uniref:CDP-diacylglycerol diphosphatase n=1 Tax=Robbsia andropogonis TaxID=28092 RepID=UPI0020A1C879|nr:CDP-diacylglycerol diphosphatase [Robbsia andropogonis]MCP1117085.1 CDP-diacylglycerol diphosphatase [Robbsia andropogonis]MCP1128432.1 CDP-diacylglycerol diphosphatase [Robbsia andropogonis]